MKQKLVFIFLLAGFFLPFVCYAQQWIPLARPLEEDEHEIQDDPYLPNAYNNNKLSPAYNYDGRLHSRTNNSVIVTHQVNVSSTHLNILGDAANEPNIAVNPLNENEIAIGWRQFDNVLSNL